METSKQGKVVHSKEREKTAEMFNDIAGSYDFLNHFLSAGIDKSWRRKAIKLLHEHEPHHILDIATGTADLAIEALTVKPKSVTGVDIAEKMLAIGREKVKKLQVEDKITLQQADACNLPFEDNSFDALTVAFGVRNFENLEKGLREMNRVMKHGGMAVILEFSNPTAFPMKQFYNFYFRFVLPTVGRLVSKHSSAYQYLPETVKAFPDGSKFVTIMEDAGYMQVERHSLTLGVASIYTGIK
ncbi:MAG: bifunctional demethylmenaquinone methyltransferase/2-methoxy-6-polyprenyl-1,4-benzoquinol methylase UbiE [Flavobacteriales bacterium]|nr:bifunctional demethylmenaquinone methyltransferase/2-methoxy-6-polyprenyl-1,4-benzoquinol methylase UbiE [Flavobacteriales bacterium]